LLVFLARLFDVFLAVRFLAAAFFARRLGAFFPAFEGLPGLLLVEARLPTAFFARLPTARTAVSAKAPAACAANSVIWSAIGFFFCGVFSLSMVFSQSR